MFIFASYFERTSRHILFNSHTITTVGLRARQMLLELHLSAQFLSYTFVVCGEPCGVWRKSAPFLYAIV